MKSYYPVCMDIRGKKCVVAGGGAVACRKVRSLLRCGGRVTVVSPKINAGLSLLEKKKQIVCRRSVYRPGFLNGADIVIAATGDEKVNRDVSMDASRKRIPVNVVDAPALSTFIVPAVLRLGDISISVSTDGRSPFLAKAVKERIQSLLGREYSAYSRICASARKKILREYRRGGERRELLRKINSSGILRMIKAGKEPDARKLAERIIREGKHVV